LAFQKAILVKVRSSKQYIFTAQYVCTIQYKSPAVGSYMSYISYEITNQMKKSRDTVPSTQISIFGEEGVCLCERERDRERERGLGELEKSFRK
jgi:hypothetical protein